MKAIAILAGLAFVAVAFLLARELEKHDASQARRWNEEQGRDGLDLGDEW